MSGSGRSNGKKSTRPVDDGENETHRRQEHEHRHPAKAKPPRPEFGEDDPTYATDPSASGDNT